MPILTTAEWKAYLALHPNAHILQTAEWGELKGSFGWKPLRIANETCGAQVLFRKLPMGFSAAYIPKGPVGTGWETLMPELDEFCRKNRAIFLKVEPDLWQPEGSSLDGVFRGFIRSNPIQPPRTVEISLEGSEDDWLARMKQKTRYNIRLAERKEVVIRESDDLETFQKLMVMTGARDGFGVHSQAYYQKAYDLFSGSGRCALIFAEYHREPLAALMVFLNGERAIYLYGASSNAERNRMPAYLIQLAAMRWAADRGARVYDLWGIPDLDENALESEFSDRGDGLWGVYRFKRGFGGSVRRAVGAWDKIYIPLLYRAYRAYTQRRGGEAG